MQYHRLESESDETLYFLLLHFLTRAGSSAISLPLFVTVALCFRRVVALLAMQYIQLDVYINLMIWITLALNSASRGLRHGDVA